IYTLSLHDALPIYAGARADQPLEAPLAALGALAQVRLLHGLEVLEAVLAGAADVVVGRHGLSVGPARAPRRPAPRAAAGRAADSRARPGSGSRRARPRRTPAP